MSPNDQRLKLVKLSFVEYYHADLAKAEKFFLDFGLQIARRSEDGTEIFFKGYGPDPFAYIARQAVDQVSRFGGAAYVVEDRHELERASRIAGATDVRPLKAPGGGEIVTLTDPAGHPVHMVYGQEPKPVEEMQLAKTVVNFEDEKPRKGAFQRFQPGPAPVFKFGHYGVSLQLWRRFTTAVSET